MSNRFFLIFTIEVKPCFRVDDLEKAKLRLESCGVKIIPDNQPVEKWIHFYFRDPGGNRLEITQKI